MYEGTINCRIFHTYTQAVVLQISILCNKSTSIFETEREKKKCLLSNGFHYYIISGGKGFITVYKSIRLLVTIYTETTTTATAKVKLIHLI